MEASYLHQRRGTSRKRSTVDESLSFSLSETSAQSSRRLHERTVIFQTRWDYALVIIGLQTGVNQLAFIYLQVERYGGLAVFAIFFTLSLVISLPLMVQQMFYGFYNKCGFMKFWNIAPVGLGIGISMALYSAYECVIWSLVAGLLVLHMAHVPFQSISEWTKCETTERPVGILCYDAESKLAATSCELSAYPGREFYERISFQPQENGKLNVAWFTCCCAVWLLVFMIVSQGFRRMRTLLIRASVAGLLAFALLAVFLITSEKKPGTGGEPNFFAAKEAPSHSSIIWLVWHAIRVIQIPLGTLYQLGSYSPPGSPLLSDAVMILLFVCFYNFAFVFFAHACVVWTIVSFNGIRATCVAEDRLILLFAAVPTAVSFLAMGNVWLFVYFAILTVKIITQIAVTLTASINAMSEMFHLHRHRQQIVGIVCTVTLLLNLPVTMIDSRMFLKRTCHFVEVMVDLCIASISCLLVVSLYTLTRVFNDMHFTYNARPVPFFKIISYLSPVLLIFFFISGIASVVSMWSVDPVFKEDRWASPFVILTVFLILAPIPGFALYTYVVHLMKHKILAMLQPTVNWGPPEADVKHARLNFNPLYELRYRSKKPCTHNCLVNNLRIKIEVEKRDCQRRDFFLNVCHIPSYAEWDDDEEWHYQGDIIGKTRAIDSAGHSKVLEYPTMAQAQEVLNVKHESEEEDGEESGDEKAGHEHDVNIYMEEETSDDELYMDVNLDEESEEGLRFGNKTDGVSVVGKEIVIPGNDTRVEEELDVIFPDLNSFDPTNRISHTTPRYVVIEKGRTLRLRHEQRMENLVEPPHASKKLYRLTKRRMKRQSKAKHCHTETGLNSFRKIFMPWKKSKKCKKHKCIGKRSDNWATSRCSNPSTSNGSSDDTEALSETDRWP